MPDFFGNGGQLYELAAMLMEKNTTSEQLRDLVETLYPDFVDADVVVSQFNVVRRLQPWTDANRYSSVPWPVHQARSNYEKCTRS